MKKNYLKFVSLFAVAFVCAIGSFAQDSTTRKSTLTDPPLFTGNQGFRTWSIGIHGGMIAPFAAVGGKNDFSKWLPNLGYGAYVKYQVSHGFGLQLDFLRGKLEGNNEKQLAGAPVVSPYQSFKTDINWATSLSGVITLGNISWSQLHTFIQPYVSFGGGAVNYNPTTVSTSGTSVNFQPNGSLTAFYVPVGLGIKANLSQSVNLDLGYTMAYVDADNLDGYYKSPYLGDKFSYAHIGLEFVLGNASKPQLARHNAPAQLAQNMKDQNDALRASLAASEERSNQRFAEMNGLKDDLNKLKMDSDGDGVSDYFDKCPGTAKDVKVDGAGCPLVIPQTKDTVTYNNTYVITEEDKKIVREAVRNLEFDFAKATIRPRSYPYLNRVADILVKKGASLKLGGHTDAIGSTEANLKLSKDRAESVKNYLVSKGADSARIEAVGYGKSQPIATNKTAKGRQTNRRVEFTLY
jgi:OOP family OmpA-OmpF porin